MKNKLLPITRREMLAGSIAIAGTWSFPGLAATTSSIKGMINTGKKRPAISPMLYGGFIEHIGNLVNHSLWSEVLDDRKFYHGVLEKAEAKPEDPRAAMRFTHKWLAVGPISAITLDKQNAYVGEHSPVITLKGSRPRGVAQSDLALDGSKEYVGRIVLAADSRAEVSITLIWGDGNSDRQTVKIPAGSEWRSEKFRFRPTADAVNGRIEITGKGSGSFRLGAVSLMPADNVKGFRADTVALMREMDCKVLRMPGGNFVSAYDWKDTIGDPDKRPPVLDPVWKTVQPNDVGVDEFLQLCQIIECEPSWCVNSGFGEPRSGAEMVEYVNGSADTHWGAKRAANGHAQPYNVKYWNIGNEMYGHWQYGHMSRDHYVVKHNLFADAMRAVDPSIYIIAPGGFVDEMTTGQGIFIEGQPQVEIGSERDWAYGMLKHCWGKFDALATHAYPPEGKRFNLKTGKLFDVKMSLNEWARQPANRVRTMVDAWEEYKKLFPKLNEGTVKVFFDEWAYHFQDDLKGALAIALTFHEFFRHTDFIDMAGYTMATGWLSYDRTQSIISTRGSLFQFYKKYYGSIPVAVDGNSPQPQPKYPVGGDQPKVNSGSATHPLDVSASLTEDGKILTVAVVNATEEARTLELGYQGFNAASEGRCWKFTGKTVDARNEVRKEPQVKVVESTFDTGADTITIAPISVEIYHFPAA